MQGKKIKTKYNRKTALFIELIIWILFLILSFTGFYLYHQHLDKHYNHYQLFLQDIDGIIVGSPVKMLGITIGYVQELKPVNDTIFVDFVLTKKGMKIPKGSIATVEFSGLASSKSLEIYPPTKKVSQDSPAIIIQRPRRLGAALGLLDDMFHKIGEIIYRCTFFGEELSTNINSIEKIHPNNKKINSKSPTENLKEIENKIDEIQNKLDSNTKRYE